MQAYVARIQVKLEILARHFYRKMSEKASIIKIVEQAKSGLDILPDDFDALLIGERHDNRPVRQHLESCIPVFAEMGIVAYGAEANVEQQQEFDKIYRAHRDSWEYEAPSTVMFGPSGDYITYRSLAYAMSRAGILPFAFDIASGFIVETEEKERARLIKNRISERGKVVALVGMEHVKRGRLGPRIVNYLEGDGLRCVTVRYCGGETQAGYTIEGAARLAKRSGDLFVVKNHFLPEKAAFDFIVHLPQH